MPDEPGNPRSDVVELYRAPRFGSSGLPSARVSIRTDGAFAKLPADLESLRADYQDRHAGERNDRRLAVRRLDWSGDELRISATASDWVEVRAWQAVLPGRRAELEHRIRWNQSSFESDLPSFLMVHAVIETADGQVIAAQRNASLAFYGGAWAFSFEEGAEETDLQPDGVLRAVALRGLREEFRVPAALAESCDVALLGVLFERPSALPALVALVRIPATALEVLAFEPNPDEVTAVAAVHLTEQALDEWRQNVKPRVSLHPTSRYRLFQIAALRLGDARTLEVLGPWALG